jgi:hypothetical protein
VSRLGDQVDGELRDLGRTVEGFAGCGSEAQSSHPLGFVLLDSVKLIIEFTWMVIFHNLLGSISR